jgi:hypothetical protein
MSETAQPVVTRVVKASGVLQNQAAQKRALAAFLRAQASQLIAKAMELENSADSMERLGSVEAQVEVLVQ